MSRKRKVVKVTRRGRIVEIPRWVHEYNQRKRFERKLERAKRLLEKLATDTIPPITEAEALTILTRVR